MLMKHDNSSLIRSELFYVINVSQTLIYTVDALECNYFKEEIYIFIYSYIIK
jgi:hypothetical protein